MRVQSVHIKGFRRFTDLTISEIPASARMVVLLGPNGCGKSSLFDAFGFRIHPAKRDGAVDFAFDYHAKASSCAPVQWHAVMEGISVRFHGYDNKELSQGSVEAKKAFYFRSAYRNEPHFSLDKLSRQADALQDENHPERMISLDARVSENYRRIVSEAVAMVYSEGGDTMQMKELREHTIGEIRGSMLRVFDDLVLEGPGDPLAQGTFFFTKGASKGFKYLNLSGGEKAAFDLLLDFVVKRQYFDDTVFCIDEPELHMHSSLQAKLLQEMYDLIPEKCQLWLATHSIGMMRKAQQLAQAHPGSVTFLDFADHDFDQPVTMRPTIPDREHWRNVFRVALDDLADLVAPRHVILCEGGRPETGARKNAEFDAKCLNAIFRREFPDVLFVSAGGTNDLERNALLLAGVLTNVVPGVTVTRLLDRDDRSTAEVDALADEGVRVLSLRDIENYLWDDAVLARLCQSAGKPELREAVLAAKHAALQASIDRKNPADDIKSAGGDTYVAVKRILELTKCGNTVEAFCRDTLAPQVTPDTGVYARLKADVFGL